MKNQLLRIINDPRRNIVVTGVAAFAGGAVAGYFLGRRRARTWVTDEYGTYEIPSQLTVVSDRGEGDDHVESAGAVIDADAYKELVKREDTIETLDVEDVVLSAGSGDVSEIIGEITSIEEDEAGLVVSASVFAGNDESWDYQAELANRSESEPYVIHKDEFFEQDNDYTQTTLTYYEGDNQLVDEEDVPIYNKERVVGELKFGHGTGGDPNVFFVRNDKNRAEYEIIRHEGMFAVEVHGLDPDDIKDRTLKHSMDRFPRDD